MKMISVGSCVVVAAFLVTGLSASAFADVPDPYRVPLVDKIAIDGKSDDWGDRGLLVEMIQNRAGEHSAPEDIDVSFRLGWDERGLLVLLSILDDIHIESPEPGKLYEGDSFEMFILKERGASDKYQIQAATGADPRFGKLRYDYNDMRQDKALAEEPLSFDIKQTRAGDRSTIELLLPWKNLGIEPKEGAELGFQLVVNDNDGDGRIARLQWYAKTDTVTDSTACHRLVLADDPCPPVLASAILSYIGSEKLRVFIVADESLAGASVDIIGGNGVKLASAPLAIDNGRARGEAVLPFPLPKAAGKYFKLHSDGKLIGTIQFELLPPPAPASGQKEFGRGIARAMHLLATSSPEKRNRVKLLFYGQSITVGDWWKQLVATLRNRYPYAELVVENRAIGGWGFHPLLRSAEYDVYPFYPDLIILQAYGVSAPGEDGALEQHIRNLRSRTAAEIIIPSHHVSHWRMDHGETPQYLADDAKYQKDMDTESKHIKELCRLYDCEFIDVREEWKSYIEENKINSRDLLYEGHIHVNSFGNQLMEMLFARHFQFNKKFPFKFPNAVVIEPVVQAADGSLKIEFTGNRIDLLPGQLSDGQKPGSARILLDGKPPSENPVLYAATRPSKAPGAFWPAFMHTSHEANLIVEDWILTVTSISAKGQSFEFDVAGSKTGPDGSGNNKEKFVSKSGRVVLEPSDWRLFGRIPQNMMEPGKIKVSWSVEPQFIDVYRASEIADPSLENAVTVAQGLENGTHTLELIPNSDGSVPIDSVRFYNPSQ